MRISEVTFVIARSWAESQLRGRRLAGWVLVDDRPDDLDSTVDRVWGDNVIHDVRQ